MTNVPTSRGADTEDQAVGDVLTLEADSISDDDAVIGDETTRDVATEHVPPPAEEAAMHLTEEPDMGEPGGGYV